MSVLLFHTSVAPFVQQVARSLDEAGQLERFVTTVCDEPNRFRQRTLCATARLARFDLAEQLRRRAVTEIPADKVESHPWGELLRLLAGRFDRDGRATDFVWERAEKGFDRRVARKLHRGLTGVYGFEYGSLATFQRARQLGLRVAYEVPAAEAHFVQAVIAEEMKRFPALRTAYHAHTSAREDERTRRRGAEWDSADLVLVNSNFTRSTYANAGFDCSKVRVTPLGAPEPVPADQAATGGRTGHPLNLLWAGKFSFLKGAHYVLEAWRSGHFGRHARLNVFGHVSLPDEIMRPLPDGIVFHGAVARSRLFEEYQQCDALLFPTLCDGFGMVATEAWSRGLPVITTARAGASDLLQPGRNGLLIPHGDTTAIATAITWCLEHREELRAMRTPAHATAARWQWSDYRQRHAAHLRAAGFFGGRS
jgi:glycosyltransferase involved in cell wall biosynthesis